MKFAIPLAEGKLTAHFGHCKEFALIDVEDNKIKNKQTMLPPPHEPGVLPRWLHNQGTNVIIAGGMGARALDLFAQNGIKVLTGAPSLRTWPWALATWPTNSFPKRWHPGSTSRRTSSASTIPSWLRNS